MSEYFIEECKERIALYSKLLMAIIGVLVVTSSGMVNLALMPSEPAMADTIHVLLLAGAALSVLCAMGIGWLLYAISAQINKIGRAK